MLPKPVMINRDTPSRTSRGRHYNPVKRKPWMPKPGEPDHPLAEPVQQLCAEIEHYKRRALRAEAALRPFAAAADVKLCGDFPDDARFGNTDVTFHLTFGDLRRARAVATEAGAAALQGSLQPEAM